MPPPAPQYPALPRLAPDEPSSPVCHLATLREGPDAARPLSLKSALSRPSRNKRFATGCGSRSCPTNLLGHCGCGRESKLTYSDSCAAKLSRCVAAARFGSVRREPLTLELMSVLPCTDRSPVVAFGINGLSVHRKFGVVDATKDKAEILIFSQNPVFQMEGDPGKSYRALCF
jgi:hypothetical protein